MRDRVGWTIVVLVACLAAAAPVRAADLPLFQLFLLNGAAIVSYGEFTRADDRVIFSMPIGGTADELRLHVVSLPADLVDWERTDRHVASARYQRYAATRGDADFLELTSHVARVLSQIALTTDRREALAIAEYARRTLADWPRAHYGYRQDEVRDVIGVLDGAISSLRSVTGSTSFELSLVATSTPIEFEPLARMPAPREQLDQILRVVEMTTQSSERVSLLTEALALVDAGGAAIDGVDVSAIRRSVGDRLSRERALDARYARLASEVSDRARRAAAMGRIAAVERIFAGIGSQDARLGRQRPELVLALQGMVQAYLESARQMRLLRDRWQLRQTQYRDYQRSAGAQLLQLVKLQAPLEAIRRLDGPDPALLQTLRTRLSGGAERLSRLRSPSEFQTAHELLVSAWRFAETAATARYDAVVSGNLDTAREASSAAAGALMMLARTQDEIRAFLEPPRLP